MSDDELFEMLLPLPPAERQAALDRETAGRPEIRNQVEELLAAADRRAQFDVTGTIDNPDETRTRISLQGEATANFQMHGVGTVIAGKYTLVDMIGEGGMGSVWRAKQTEPVNRFVAIKLIKAGMDSKQVLARFEAERQALALMDHPNIAKVLDGGLQESRPYFVMELVKGTPITDYCDAHKLTPKQRLELFVPVCQAIQHAHQKGIIHRDIKPSNVLIAMYDDRPVPKVIDFGVAKATGGTLTEHTIDTGFGGIVGTPQYMSPEQATFNNLDIDTRSDVYSLGVLLYELLTGSPPFAKRELEKKGLLEILRVVREEDPPRPSTKLSTADALASLSANRGTEPKKLTGILRNELDWIVMKSLEKDRARRYETANGFAADVNRYLSGEAVIAHPPSTSYRVKKFVRRYKGQVIAATMVFVALIAGVIGTTLGLFEARNQAEFAKKQEELARDEASAKEIARAEEALQRKRAIEFRNMALNALRATTDTDVELLIGGKRELGASEKAYLEAIAKRWQAFAIQEGTDEQARVIRAEGHHQVSRLWFNLGRREEGKREGEYAVAIRKKLVADYPSVPDYRCDLARILYNLALGLRDLGEKDEAEKHHKLALAILKNLVAEFPDVPDYRRHLASNYSALGILLRRKEKSADAEEHYKQALAIMKKLVSDYPALSDYRDQLAKCHNNLGLMLPALGRGIEAAEQLNKSIAIKEKLILDFPAIPAYRRDLSQSHNSLGRQLARMGNPAEAVVHHYQALTIQKKLVADFPAVSDYHSHLAESHHDLGMALKALSKGTEAEEQLNSALTIRVKLAGDYPSLPDFRRDLAATRLNLGNLLKDSARRVEAVEQYEKCRILLEKLDSDFPDDLDYRKGLATTYNSVGSLQIELGKLAEAERNFLKAIGLLESLVTHSPDVSELRSFLALSRFNLGVILATMGKKAESEKQFEKVLPILEKLAADSPDIPEYRNHLADVHDNLGCLLAGLGKPTEAEKHFRKTVSLLEKLITDFPNVVEYRQILGRSYFNCGTMIRGDGRNKESLVWFDKAITMLTSIYRAKPLDLTIKMALRDSHVKRASAYYDLQQYVDVVKDWDRAIDLSPLAEQSAFRALRATAQSQAGMIAEAMAEVSELTKSANWNEGQLYDFACVYGLASGKLTDKKRENADRAMELLLAAVKSGFKDAVYMKKDTDLDSLRDRDDFKKLIAELEKKAEKK